MGLASGRDDKEMMGRKVRAGCFTGPKFIRFKGGTSDGEPSTPLLQGPAADRCGKSHKSRRIQGILFGFDVSGRSARHLAIQGPLVVDESAQDSQPARNSDISRHALRQSLAKLGAAPAEIMPAIAPVLPDRGGSSFDFNGQRAARQHVSSISIRKCSDGGSLPVAENLWVPCHDRQVSLAMLDRGGRPAWLPRDLRKEANIDCF
jgi:hypothetical protein